MCIRDSTGAMYRGLAVHFLKKGIVPGEVEKIEAACEDAKVELGYENGVQQVYLNGENITSQLREEAVGNMASVSSAVPAVRAKPVSYTHLQMQLYQKSM